MRKKIFAILCASLLVSSCATFEEMHKNWVKKNCTPGAAYNAGLTHGLTPHQMPERDYASQCPSNNEALNSAYLKGFSEGVKSRPQEININKNLTVKTDNPSALSGATN